VDPHLPPDAARRLRKAVLDQFNDFYGLALDLLESVALESPVAVNEHWMTKLGEIHEAVVGDAPNGHNPALRS
jgi:hypothetical protein